MISRQKLKYIKSLQLKKYQKQEQKFLVEGEKSVLEILNSRYKINILLATKRFLEIYQGEISDKQAEVIELSQRELEKTGSLKTNSGAIAVVEMPPIAELNEDNIRILPVFDNLQDPGNLGTIIRTCDWYGLDTIILSENSVDVYNPKVIQGSMGSFARVNVIYRELQAFLNQSTIPVYGTSPQGDSLYGISWPKQAIIVFGNESKGISPNLTKYFSRIVSIPKSGQAESLNVAIATAIVMDNFKRSEASG